MINANHVKRLNVGVLEVSFLEESFKNLCHSILTARTYGFMHRMYQQQKSHIQPGIFHQPARSAQISN